MCKVSMFKYIPLSPPILSDGTTLISGMAGRKPFAFYTSGEADINSEFVAARFLDTL